MKYNYKTKGTCSAAIEFDLGDDGRVTGINFLDGCDGNLKAIAKFADGLTVPEIEAKCAGITCGRKRTSCADQLSLAVRKAYDEMNRQ
jgi:uncharacterized protein (TIGR03905 family)